jgi:hypothetical protein
MIQKIKNIVFVVASLATLCAPLALVGSVAANALDIGNSLCGGTNGDLTGTDTSNCAAGDSSTATSSVASLLQKAVNIFSAVVGVIAVIFIIYGGLKYITSAGDPGNVTAAKNTIIYAIIGLVVVALAQFIVHFVINQANSVSGS